MCDRRLATESESMSPRLHHITSQLTAHVHGQEALARQAEEADAAMTERLAEDLKKRLKVLRESRELRRQALQI